MNTGTRRVSFAFYVALTLLVAPSLARSQGFSPAGTVRVPASSVRPFDKSFATADDELRAYTNLQIFVPDIPVVPLIARAPRKSGSAFVETPASIACIYGLVPKKDGCNPNIVGTNAKGGGGVIVIVSAYHAPKIQQDLAEFSRQFVLPQADIEVVFASGKQPKEDPTPGKGWEIESSLDVQWARAIAPNAKIVLVEAESLLLKDMLRAVEVANKIVEKYGAGQISMSWGSLEYATQKDTQAIFAQKGATYFAASGDHSIVNLPAALAGIVAVGGTRILRDAKGQFLDEIAWTKSGAGPSRFETKPAYQNGIGALSGKYRGIADISGIGDASNGGIFVYVSRNPEMKTNGGWMQLGGTSAATVIVASIANAAAATTNQFRSSSYDLLQNIYLKAREFSDITKGTCGSHSAMQGWDYCTGLGTPKGYKGFN